jgi:phenylpropionate dioxygenase-like ring-hydroxylating dioxygenase large terminal subunit
VATAHRISPAAAPVEPPMPVGWYGVLFSDELALGQVKPLHAFGVDLVAFRGDDGRAGILDAYCAHMGAHLGHGGTIDGACVVCPFHRWRWRADGQCDAIPYSTRIPSRAQIRSWPVLERNGFVFCWYHPSGDPPTWEVSEIAQTSAPGWSIRRRSEWGPFPSHAQELSENGVDFQHFEVIHGFTIRGIDWEPDGPRYRLAYDMEPLTAGDGSEYTLDSLTEGPGFTRSIMAGAIDAVSAHSWFPTDPGMLAVKSLYFFSPDSTEAVVDRAYENSRSGWVKDIEIWSNKRYMPHPLLVPGDGPVVRFRSWFDQFYP